MIIIYWMDTIIVKSNSVSSQENLLKKDESYTLQQEITYIQSEESTCRQYWDLKKTDSKHAQVKSDGHG